MDNMEKILVFELNNERYGVSIKNVLSIEKVEQFTNIPNSSSFIKGIISLRGVITPVIDLKERLHLGEIEKTDLTRLLIVTLNDMQIGLLVESATDVIDIPTSIIDSTPIMFSGTSNSLIHGVAKLEDELLVLLDLENIFQFHELGEVESLVD
ncbi:chemotaxis protein CheW [Salirhabdus sp. Marseille-P4669]|uniref:chemotaxis protein CheW n=1 Tax=Salirhabdus sp. Marseille-P4669 TaxID=2042310 RepID=UPI000C7DF223|nr:chemotaxis protein CheW [Salirhabdus sp. Marseille-P4669]